MKTSVKNSIGGIVSIGLGVLLIVWSLSQLTDAQKTDILNAMRNADPFWILMAVLIGIVSHLSRAYRWKYLLEPLGYRPRFLNRVFAVFIGYFVNLLIPRGGEVVRATVLNKYEKVPFEKAFGTILTERVVDLILLLLIILTGLLYQFSYIKELVLKKIPGNLLGLGLLGIGLLVLAWVAYNFLKKSQAKPAVKLRNFIKGLWEGMVSILHMKHRVAFVFHSVFIWSMYLLMFYVVALAIPETANLSTGATLSGFIGGSIGTTANGGLGTFPFAVQKVLELYHINPDKAYAFGWLMWSIQTVMILTIGLVSVLLIPFYNGTVLNKNR